MGNRDGTIGAVALCTLLLACGTSSGPPADQPPGGNASQPAGARMSDTERRLFAAVQQLQNAGSVGRRSRTIAALRALDPALRDLPRSWESHARIAAATRNDIVDPAQWQALLEDCLEQVLQTLLEASPPRSMVVDYWRALDALSSAFAGLADPASAARESLVVDSLRAATDALFILRGGRPPFDAGGTPGDEPAATIAASMRAARDALRDLRAQNAASARTAAARALGALADVLSTWSRSTGATATPFVARMRLQSTRLRRLDRLAMDESRWTKAGLDAALDGLASMTHGRSGAGVPLPLATWIEESRLAVASVDDRQTFPFQRAAIQDAFRMVATAFAIVTHSEAGFSVGAGALGRDERIR